MSTGRFSSPPIYLLSCFVNGALFVAVKINSVSKTLLVRLTFQFLDWSRSKDTIQTGDLADLRENFCPMRAGDVQLQAGWLRQEISSAGYTISLLLCKIHMVLSYCHKSLKGSIQSGANLNYQGVSTWITRLCPEEDLYVPTWCLPCDNSQAQTCFMYSFEIKTLN